MIYTKDIKVLGRVLILKMAIKMR